MESYEAKWYRLQEYVPFLKKMIDKLGNRRTTEMLKIKSLHRALTEEREGRLRMETLLKCEEILKALYEKVECPVIESPSSPTPPPDTPASPPSSWRSSARPRIIPLERRHGLEFHHDPNPLLSPPSALQPATYGEYRRIKEQKKMSVVPPLKEPDSDELSDSESESLQIDEGDFLSSKEEKILKQSPRKPLSQRKEVTDPPLLETPKIKPAPCSENIPAFLSSTKDLPFASDLAPKEAGIPIVKLTAIKTRNSTASKLHEKILHLHDRMKTTRSHSNIKITKVKEKRPSPVDHQVIVTKQPYQYSNNIMQIIQKLKNVVSNDKSNPPTTDDLLSLLKDRAVKIRERNRSGVSSLKHTTYQGKTENLIFLFKCWIKTCNYATDSIQMFKDHIKSEIISETDLFPCVYCEKTFVETDGLINHIVYVHGTCPFQCPYCVYRFSSKISLLIHQQHLHPEKRRGYYLCKNLNAAASVATEVRKVYCAFCQDFSHEDPEKLSNHLQECHQESSSTSIQFYCTVCNKPFVKAIDIFIHHAFEHSQFALRFGILNTNNNVVELDQDISENIFKCGRESCEFETKIVQDFSKHLVKCGSSSDSHLCGHCCESFEKISSLISHIQTHGSKRFYCGICQHKDSVSSEVVKHMKLSHGVSKTSLTPRDVALTNNERDEFVILPKSSFKRNLILKDKKAVYFPDKMNDIPKISMFKSPAYCSECDFTSKVRANFIKHLKLHNNFNKVNDITPINSPPYSDGRNFKSMASTCDKETSKISDKDLALMPAFIPNNERFKCCSPDCSYIAIDEIMLIYHIKTLHSAFKDKYICPHCKGVEIEHEEVNFHLKCHGELLFKCCYCLFYHWQKRTAEKHAREDHRDARGSVRNVRLDEEAKKLEKLAVKKRKKIIETSTSNIKPYRCGLCDQSYDSIEEIRNHTISAHSVSQQFICGLCNFATDLRPNFKTHLDQAHQGYKMGSIYRFYLQQIPLNEKLLAVPHYPLWKRNIPGQRFIRGIQIDDGEKPPVDSKVSSDNIKKEVTDIESSSPYEPKCIKCGVVKKTIKSLKMHIQLSHLKNGKFICKYCTYSTNSAKCIKFHGQKHKDIDKFEFEEKQSASKVYSHDYWKLTWNIPKPRERKKLGYLPPNSPSEVKVSQKLKPKPNLVPSQDENDKKNKICSIDKDKKVLKKNTDVCSIQEKSAFEHVPTFKCLYCPERTQSLIRIEHHTTTEHSEKSSGHKLLTREQVIEMITFTKSNLNDYACYICDKSGTIFELQDHFTEDHSDQTLKVISKQKTSAGYLECQICGHLTPGFDRSLQKAHFHDEHPLEENVRTNKYMLHKKTSSNKNELNGKKFDLKKYNGELITCPKEKCDFNSKSIPAIMAHIRRHTQSFKCGHCGNTFGQSSEFHRHSAMVHGDKIPDLVKDIAAEAEFEALKGLLEGCLNKIADPL